ncbi:hypothetical protein SAMN04487886_100934 [Clostridium sp. DSM 8431]|uniref:hypothetical protein n=1 Tax=Clostridium sp. DSM 8431 TaxID=1761781 RepID=UPI0008E282D9|nr:hypothetical protein [Clostridium sp. DSM 8431]SFU33961.1 hypothetical protein SAMN04487886_100934 [Clostridium sp. DSM 8431]
MSGSDFAGLIFAGISALGAIVGLPSGISAWKSKNSINKTKEDIEQYRNIIKEKNALLKLKPQIQELKKQSKIFLKLSMGDLPQQGMKKSELDYYKEIMESLNDILNDISANYDSERNLIRDIDKALGYCIEEEMTLKQVDRTCIYGYSMVKDNFEQVIKQLGSIIEDLEC